MGKCNRMSTQYNELSAKCHYLTAAMRPTLTGAIPCELASLADWWNGGCCHHLDLPMRSAASASMVSLCLMSICHADCYANVVALNFRHFQSCVYATGQKSIALLEISTYCDIVTCISRLYILMCCTLQLILILHFVTA